MLLLVAVMMMMMLYNACARMWELKLFLAPYCNAFADAVVSDLQTNSQLFLQGLIQIFISPYNGRQKRKI